MNREADRLGRFARQVLFYETVSSTNDVAAALAEGGAPEGCLVIADAQSAGRGRLGRTWASPPGAGLYVSVVLRPETPAIPLLTVAAGIAVAQGVEIVTGLRPDLKWPNDVFIDRRKVAGILAEGTLRYIILGIGINVMRGSFPPDIAARATSLETELGRPVDRTALLVECLASFVEWYALLRGGDRAAVTRAWRARAGASLGRRVRWDGAGTQVDGVVEDIDIDGALIVRTPERTLRVISGEVTWL